MSGARNTTTVFVVDDEHLVADTIALVLRSAGFAVEAFYDPAKALERAAECHPDILLSDVAMPGMDGYGLASLIRCRHPNCRIVLMSGHATVLQSEHENPAAAYLLLPKPIAPLELLALLSEQSELQK